MVEDLRMKDLGVIDLKVLNLLMSKANKQGIIIISANQIAKEIGYKATGGGITYALKYLIATNRLIKVDKWTYKVLV